MPEVKYRIEFDQGGNPGIKCPVCGQLRWKSNHDTKDWATGQPCPNCVEMKEQGIWDAVNSDVQAQKVELEDNFSKLSAKKKKEFLDKDEFVFKGLKKTEKNVGIDEVQENVKG